MGVRWITPAPFDVKRFTGNFNVQDAATSTTPFAITGGAGFTKLPNDGLGSLTTAANAPTGLTPLWNPSTGQFDFSQLKLGDQVMLRADIIVNTSSPNVEVHFQLEAGIGIFAFPLNWDHNAYKSAGAYPIAKTSIITMDTTTALNGKAELQLSADANVTVEVQGWNYIITRRSF